MVSGEWDEASHPGLAVVEVTWHFRQASGLSPQKGEALKERHRRSDQTGVMVQGQGILNPDMSSRVLTGR